MRLWFHGVDSLVLFWTHFSLQHVLLLLHILHSLLHRLLALVLPIPALEALTDVQWWSSETVSILSVSS
jgi:hypothetical protein